MGDASVTVRLPSVILGAATVPLVHLLGERTVGRRGALVGAGIVAIAPFAIFYGVEARAYASLAFVSALSTLLLLVALDRSRPVHWIFFALSSAAVLYTHYSGVFVVIAQGAWALWARRDRMRPLLLSYAGVAIAFAPWLPSYVEQDDYGSVQAELFDNRFPLSLDTVTDMVAHVLPGYPFVPLGEVPGGIAVALAWAAIALAAALRAARLGQAQSRPPQRELPLLVVLTLATPLGLIVYSLQPDTSLLLPRNLSASLPAFALAVGAVLTSLRPPLAAAATALVLGPLLVGAVQTLDAEHERPQTREVARFLDRYAGARDAVLSERGYNFSLYFDRRHAVSAAAAPVEWAPAGPGGEVFVVKDGGAFPAFAGSSGLMPLRAVRTFPGIVPLSVARYGAPVSGVLRDAAGRPRSVEWSLGPDARVSSQGGRGVVEGVSFRDGLLTVSGWTIGPGGRHADVVLVFAGGRLVLAGRPSLARPDIRRAHGAAAEPSGFRLEGRPAGSPAPARVDVLAVSGARAALLQPLSDADR